MTPQEQAKGNMLRAAQVYARFDRTDPFALRRAVTHIEIGLASVHRGPNNEWSVDAGPAFYDAEQHREARKIVGHDGTVQTYDIPVYRNVRRP
jgi:hypothetical protein